MKTKQKKNKNRVPNPENEDLHFKGTFVDRKTVPKDSSLQICRKKSQLVIDRIEAKKW